MRRNRRIILCSLATALAPACGDSRTASGGDPIGPGIGSATAGGTMGGDDGGSGMGPASGEAGGDSHDPDGGNGVRLDVGPGGNSGDDGSTDKPGCDKVDFLFVIDNSGSMGDEQTQLIASFGDFIDTISQEVKAQDYHIMVVDTDASGGGGSSSTMCSNGSCTCTPAPGCCETLCNSGFDSCNGNDCSSLPPAGCNATLGAGNVHRYDGMVCMSEDPRYMTDTTSNLESTFACVAQVGTYGDGNERPMQAMATAVGEQNQSGQCNDGFLRSDAILVVTFITDEEEEVGKSPGDPPDWADALVAAKGGNKDAIVVLGLYGDNHLPGGICGSYTGSGSGAEPGYRLQQFVEIFGNRGFSGSVCSNDYDMFFDEAVSIIDFTCDEFDPAG